MSQGLNQTNIKIWTTIVLEKGDDLLGKGLSSAEALGVQHDLGNELSVGFGHSQTAEKFLQVVRQIRAASIARVHGNKDGHFRAHLHLFVQQLSSDWGA